MCHAIKMTFSVYLLMKTTITLDCVIKPDNFPLSRWDRQAHEDLFELIELSSNELNGVFLLDTIKLKIMKATNCLNKIFKGTISPQIKHTKLLNKVTLSPSQSMGALPSEIG